MNCVFKKICLGLLVISCSTTMPMGYRQEQRQPQDPFLKALVNISYLYQYSRPLFNTYKEARDIFAGNEGQKNSWAQRDGENSLLYMWRTVDRLNTLSSCLFKAVNYATDIADYAKYTTKDWKEAIFGKDYLSGMQGSSQAWADTAVGLEKSELQKDLSLFVACKPAEAKKCYYTLLKKWHPDKANGCANKAKRFGVYAQIIIGIAQEKGISGRKQGA